MFGFCGVVVGGGDAVDGGDVVAMVAVAAMCLFRFISSSDSRINTALDFSKLVPKRKLTHLTSLIDINSIIPIWAPDVCSTHPSVQTPSWKVSALQELLSPSLQVPVKPSDKHFLAQSTGFISPASTRLQPRYGIISNLFHKYVFRSYTGLCSKERSCQIAGTYVQLQDIKSELVSKPLEFTLALLSQASLSILVSLNLAMEWP